MGGGGGGLRVSKLILVRSIMWLATVVAMYTLDSGVSRISSRRVLNCSRENFYGHAHVINHTR